ncbi:MAG TPA: hypothetical protein VK718_04690 [Ferruginibacter sp.]|jgi:hypothetical protein|nr:hypothetical protein [Ferruginibacter sp.]
MLKSINLILLFSIFSNTTFSQNKNIRIIVTANDSVFVWNGILKNPDGINEFSIEKATILDFDNDKHFVYNSQSVCGRGQCENGIEINYYANGMMESKGSYGFTTNIDSLKYQGSDGILDNIDKVGYWYFWNEKGFLIRREKWKLGKLIEVINYKTSIAKKSHL